MARSDPFGFYRTVWDTSGKSLICVIIRILCSKILRNNRENQHVSYLKKKITISITYDYSFSSSSFSLSLSLKNHFLSFSWFRILQNFWGIRGSLKSFSFYRMIESRSRNSLAQPEITADGSVSSGCKEDKYRGILLPNVLYMSTSTFFSPPPPPPSLLLSVHKIIPRRRPSVLPGCCTIAESSCNDVPAVRSRERQGGAIRATKRSASPARRRRRKGPDGGRGYTRARRRSGGGGREWDNVTEGCEPPKDSISRTSSPRRTGRIGRSFSEFSRGPRVSRLQKIDTVTGERRSVLSCVLPSALIALD